MLFHSLDFLLFFPAVVALFFATQPRHRWALLLAASYLFYGAWKPQYLLLLCATSAVDFGVGVLLERQEDPVKRKRLIAASLIANLGVLFVFKYFNFFSALARDVATWLALPFATPSLDLLLPVGVSFYTFQSISYTIDVYRRELKAESHLGKFALYVAFFPQLVAGPIERSTRLMPQFHEVQRWDTARAVSGLQLMLWGFFKKLVIADRAARFVDEVYRSPEQFQGPTVVLATYAFAYQIYCDFSGYTDIARGASRVMGFELMENFDQPYLAATITDFWRRWHVSLSTWFRDYLYIPLGGGRTRGRRRAVNLMIVFLTSGLWHGASWTFVAWGALHGLLMVVALLASWLWLQSGLVAARPLVLLGKAAGVVLTFHLVCLGWVFFRADSIHHALALLARLPVTYPLGSIEELARIGPEPPSVLLVDLAILAASVFVVEVRDAARRLPSLSSLPAPLRWLGWSLLLVWVLLTAVQSHTPFLYFQF
jgi:alginate O-acetyltransferase complex protein AlgI